MRPWPAAIAAPMRSGISPRALSRTCAAIVFTLKTGRSGSRSCRIRVERRHERRRLRRGAHHQRDRRHVLLRQWQEEERARFLADHHVLAVADHPDDLRPVALTSSQTESPADGVLPGPQLRRHRRVDERHARRLRRLSVLSRPRPPSSRAPVVSRNRGPTTLKPMERESSFVPGIVPSMATSDTWMP